LKAYPTNAEEILIGKIQAITRNEFSLVRLTPTMLKKYTIDAKKPIRKILKENAIFDFDQAVDGEKYYQHTLIFSKNGISSVRTSFFRPKAKPKKPGDPRIWPSMLGRLAPANTLLYITHHNRQVVIIPICPDTCTQANITTLFGAPTSDTGALEELLRKLAAIHDQWIESCSPKNKNDKDVGETLETALGIAANNIAGADYKGEIEIKSKRKSSATQDTLFSMVPLWKISRIKSVREMILTYGYPSRSPKKPNFCDLYCDVNTRPNPQGLYLVVDDEKECVTQFHSRDKKKAICHWPFELIEKKLLDKHPKTAWVVAEEKVTNGKRYFKYETVEVTQKPIFSQFLNLIRQDLVVYNWRGGQDKSDTTKRDDYGHPFRLKNKKHRCRLFGNTTSIDLENYKDAIEPPLKVT